jgi:hypothetical protein
VEEKHLKNVLNWFYKLYVWTDSFWCLDRLDKNSMSTAISERACGQDFNWVPVSTIVWTYYFLCPDKSSRKFISAISQTRVWTGHLRVRIGCILKHQWAHFSFFFSGLSLSLFHAFSLSFSYGFDLKPLIVVDGSLQTQIRHRKCCPCYKIYVFTNCFEVTPKILVPLYCVDFWEFEFDLSIFFRYCVFWSVIHNLQALGFTFGEKSK